MIPSHTPCRVNVFVTFNECLFPKLIRYFYILTKIHSLSNQNIVFCNIVFDSGDTSA